MVPPDNNRSKAALRCVAVGRKTFLSVGHEDDGANLAGLYSLVASRELNWVNPVEYQADVPPSIDESSILELSATRSPSLPDGRRRHLRLSRESLVLQSPPLDSHRLVDNKLPGRNTSSEPVTSADLSDYADALAGRQGSSR